MIQEQYVSFEVAKLLKEKGFDEECWYWYEEDGYFKDSNDDYGFQSNSDHISDDFICSAPTLQMVMKWLREVHAIHIELNWDKGNQLYNFNIWKPGKYQPEISSLDLWRIYKDDNYLGEWNYEEACESAIKYCLENLI